jgi:hypothetical protein
MPGAAEYVNSNTPAARRGYRRVAVFGAAGALLGAIGRAHRV